MNPIVIGKFRLPIDIPIDVVPFDFGGPVVVKGLKPVFQLDIDRTREIFCPK